MSLADSVAAALEGRSRLLVFDNCEHVLDAAADMIEAILAALGRPSTILATSREGLRLADEQLWPVPSLDVRRCRFERRDVCSSSAHRQSRPACRHSTTMTDAVVEICRRLDGIPLAIELAASRMLSMTVTEVRDRLDDRFRLLVGSRRGLERHQTLRHAVQWSYDLLDDDEKALLDKMFGIRGRLRPRRRQCGSGVWRRVRHAWICSMPWSANRFWSPTGRQAGPGSRCWRPFANSPKNNSSTPASADERAPRTPATSPGGKPMCSHCGMVRGNARPTTGSPSNCANLRTAFRWAADHDDLDTAAAIAVYAAFLGYWSRTVRAGRVGRGTHRTRADCQTSSAGTALQHGRTVLRSRPEWWRSPLRRRRPRHHRKRTLRRNPV